MIGGGGGIPPQKFWPVVLNPGSTQERTAQAGDIPLDGDGDPLVAAYAAVGAPTADHDAWDTAGIGRTFTSGSQWIDTGDGAVYVCTDASEGAAVWTQIAGASSESDARYTYPTAQASAPTADNDTDDTAGLGRTFKAGDIWIDTSTGALYTCADATAGAAEWAIAAPPLSGLWEDLRFPAQGINPPGAVSDPDRDANTGLLRFDDGSTEMITGVAQMPHSWIQGTTVEPHLHWYAGGADPGANDQVVWRFEYAWVNNNEAIPASLTAVDSTLTVSPFSGGNPILDIDNLTPAGLDGTGKRDSSVLFWRLSRIGGDAADTYVGDVILLEFDIHYLTNALGSFSEFGDA